MPNHEEFRELCALAAIGQLSSDEYAALSQHLCDCAECRQASAEYTHVVEHQLPQADPVRWKIKGLVPKSLPDLDLRTRFLARARVEGLEFSNEAEKCVPGRRAARFFAGWSWQTAFASAALIAVVFAGLLVGFHERKSILPTGGDNDGKLVRQNAELRSELAAVQSTIEQKTRELEYLNRQSSTSTASFQHLREQMDQLRAESLAMEAQLRQTEADHAALITEAGKKDATIADLKSRNERLHQDNAENMSARVLLGMQVRDLNDSMQAQNANLERELQLASASKDVQRLMGARNLHIMDVHDTNGAGVSAKAFGRVFYAEGQSLVFYAFDLPSGKLSAARYTFQGWGQKESQAHSVRNLGTFSIDDHDQRRWVLKVDDPKVLKGIDSVFVTAEATEGVAVPRGKKLLYAFMVGEPNHP